MTKRRGFKAAALGILLAMGQRQSTHAQPSTPAESSPQPVPFTVPLMRQPPTIDGLVEPDEWDAAHGFDGFVGADKVGVSTGLVVTENAQGQVRGYVGATADAIHVAVVSRIPDGTPLKATFKQDTWEAVSDDSIEVFVNPTPEEEKRADYHRLFNSLGFGAYLVHDIGSADQTPPWLKPATWRGDWPMKQAVHDGWWYAEVTIPLASMPGIAPAGAFARTLYVSPGGGGPVAFDAGTGRVRIQGLPPHELVLVGIGGQDAAEASRATAVKR